MAQTKTKSKAKARAKPKARTKPKARPKPKARSKPKNREKPKAKPSPTDNGGSKLPLIAGGAALVGAAGGIALGAARSGSRLLGVKLPQPRRFQIHSQDLSKAAKEVGNFGDRLGDLTTELRSLRNGLADGPQNSPLEILLKGLTARR